MHHFYKYSVLLLFLIGLTGTMSAQVKFSLSLMGDQKTYLVSMISDSKWTGGQNAVASAQVVLRYAAEKPFLAGKITSLVEGISWIDNAYVERPNASRDFNFVCFTLNEKGTKKIPFPQGEEVPLFTFVNLSKDCVGKLELLDNQHQMVKEVLNRDRLNITQNITVLGARGNAYAGVLNGSVDCAAGFLTSTKETQPLVNELRVFPVPANEQVQVTWENIIKTEPTKLLVANTLGEIVEQQDTKGTQSLKINVSRFSSGLYTGTLINALGQTQHFRFIVAH